MRMAAASPYWCHHSFLQAVPYLLQNHYLELASINGQLWDIEDWIRECEQRKDFGAEFIQLARSIYVTNDRRSQVKKIINTLTGSDLVEEKSYKNYE